MNIIIRTLASAALVALCVTARNFDTGDNDLIGSSIGSWRFA